MEVEPIRDMNDVRAMYKWLLENKTPKVAECFLIGCNIALRAGDLLTLRFDQFDDGQEKVVIREQKNGFRKDIPVVDTVRDAIARLKEYYDNAKPYKTKDFEAKYLFQSTSNRCYHLCQPICIQWLGETFKEAAKAVGIDYNVNTHSMRKTWGYHAYENDTDISYIQALLNHKDQKTTLRYIGVTRDSITKLLHAQQLDIAQP